MELGNRTLGDARETLQAYDELLARRRAEGVAQEGRGREELGSWHSAMLGRRSRGWEATDQVVPIYMSIT